MDQGLAAVWAGVAGLAGAGVGGCFAVWGTVIGGRKAVEAAQEQEARAARAEHQHWQRQQRFEAYQALTAAAEPLVTWRDRVPWEEARSGIDPVRTAVHRVQMLGPAGAAHAALRLPRIGAQATRAQWPWVAMTDPCPPDPGVPRDVVGYPDWNGSRTGRSSGGRSRRSPKRPGKSSTSPPGRAPGHDFVSRAERLVCQGRVGDR